MSPASREASGNPLVPTVNTLSGIQIVDNALASCGHKSVSAHPINRDRLWISHRELEPTRIAGLVDFILNVRVRTTGSIRRCVVPRATLQYDEDKFRCETSVQISFQHGLIRKPSSRLHAFRQLPKMNIKVRTQSVKPLHPAATNDMTTVGCDRETKVLVDQIHTRNQLAIIDIPDTELR